MVDENEISTYNIYEHMNSYSYKGGNMNEKYLYQLSEFYKVFGDYTRLRIMSTILEDKLCVSDIANKLNMSESAISHQLKTLRAMRFVKTEKIGKNVYYELQDEHIFQIMKVGIAHIEEKEDKL